MKFNKDNLGETLLLSNKKKNTPLNVISNTELLIY